MAGFDTPADMTASVGPCGIATATSLPRSAPRRAPEIRCRRLRPGESGLYRALRMESLWSCPESFGDTHDEEARKARSLFESAIEERAADRFVVGAFCAGRLVGLAGFARRDRLKTWHCGDVKQVYVRHEHRGRATGRALLHAVLERAFDLPGLERVELSVVSANAPAIRLYEQLGFETWGVQQDQFKLGERRWHLCHMRLTRERHGARLPPSSA